MQKFKLIIKPISPFRTPFHSDTMFGHMCWALRYLKGEKELTDFLEFLKMKECTFLISDGFPEGYVPMPILRPLTPDEERELESYFTSRLEFVRTMKGLKDIEWIEIRILEEFKDNLSYFEMLNTFLKSDRILSNPDVLRIDEVWHNSKNRLTDRVSEGKLFSKEDIFYKEDTRISVYISTDYFDSNTLSSIWDFISKSGYGADKSSGRGLFRYELKEGWDLPASERPNSFITLSHYFPAENEIRDGFYSFIVKFGKLGGHFASGIDGGPFKVPVVMMEPGSLFYPAEEKPFYGQILSGVHKVPQIVHYALSLPLKVRSL